MLLKVHKAWVCYRQPYLGIALLLLVANLSWKTGLPVQLLQDKNPILKIRRVFSIYLPLLNLQVFSSFWLFSLWSVNRVTDLQLWITRSIWDSWIGLFKSSCLVHALTLKASLSVNLETPISIRPGEYPWARMADWCADWEPRGPLVRLSAAGLAQCGSTLFHSEPQMSGPLQSCEASVYSC